MTRRILHLVRSLESRPAVADIAGVAVRNFAGPPDIDDWLKLRRRAFERETPAVRDWDRGDFWAEFMAKPWWSPERFWLAEATTPDGEGPRVIGAITLAMRDAAQAGRLRYEGSDRALPVIHWLMVLPEWRRRGLGRLLLMMLEAACWDAGHRRIGLETHAAWSAAVEFYRAMGYAERRSGFPA